jgi:basic membrane protein A
VTTFAAAILAGALTLTACGGSSSTNPKPADGGNTTSSSPKSDLKVGMAYDIGGRGDQSF